MTLSQDDLSKNFTLSSMVRSSTADSLGIKNTPNAKELRNLKSLVTKLLQPLRDDIGLPIHVNSGFRNDATNKAVGGVSTSAHRLGYAADIVCPGYKGGNVKEFCKYIENWLTANNVAFDQLIYEHIGNSKWVHIGIKNANGLQRKQVLTIRNRKTYQGIV